jgi:hypothetical protein
MVNLPLILFITCFTWMPPHQQNVDKIKEIVFKSGSRSFQKTVSITKEQMIISRNNALSGKDEKVESKISTKQWKDLLNTISNDSLEDLINLPSPTMERARDAANYSSIRIITDQKTYNCGSFDDHNPHQKLKPLLKAILDLSY